MASVSLEEAKRHLLIAEGDEADDADLSLKIDAAEELVAGMIRRSIPWVGDDGEPAPVPATIKSAILLIVADLDANREASIVGANYADNPRLEALVSRWRSFA